MFASYNDLISFAKAQLRIKGKDQPYWEQHHIIPKSLGGSDTTDNLVLLSVKEHVEAHYLLAIQYEHTNQRYYYANLNAAWIICHGKSKFTERKREEVEKWLLDPEAQAFTLQLKERLRGQNVGHPGIDSYKNKPRVWVYKNTQKPKRILESSRNSNHYKSFVQIKDCPICHKDNSLDSFACCKEHENQYLEQKRLEYKELKSDQTTKSWNRPNDRQLRISNNNGKHGPKEKHIWITNGEKDILILLSQEIPAGFKRGRTKNIPLNRYVARAK